MEETYGIQAEVGEDRLIYYLVLFDSQDIDDSRSSELILAGRYELKRIQQVLNPIFRPLLPLPAWPGISFTGKIDILHHIESLEDA